MNFFKSILSDDPEPEHHQVSEFRSPSKQKEEEDDDDEGEDENEDEDENEVEVVVNETEPNTTSSKSIGWSFGGFVKTLATRSESVLETYRRDLKEFGSGLKKETDLFREAASRAVKELPASIEVGASAIDGVLKSTAEIIAHGKDSLLAPSDHDSDASETRNYSERGSNSRQYSRFDLQLTAIQNDARTYCEEPDDLDEYSEWKQGLVWQDKIEEIDSLIETGGAIEVMRKKVAPGEVDEDTFWLRYFYRVHKLKQQEDMRAKLVRRSLSADDEELTWDVDDDDNGEDEEEANAKHDNFGNKDLGINDSAQVVKDENSDGASEQNAMSSEVKSAKESPKIAKEVIPVGELKAQSSGVIKEGADKNGRLSGIDKSKPSTEYVSEEKKSGGKIDNGESNKDNDVSVVSAQPSVPEEEDLGWDEIEDLGSNDGNKITRDDDKRSKADEHKRLSSKEEDEEDLSWDIEDDDEPVKAW